MFQHPAFLATKLESQILPTTFEQLGLKPELIERLKDLNIDYPTTIQAKAIPNILQGLYKKLFNALFILFLTFLIFLCCKVIIPLWQLKQVVGKPWLIFCQWCTES